MILVKIEFATELVMIYLNYTWDQSGTSPLEVFARENKGNDLLTWNSYNFKSFVKGNLITPNTSAEFINAPGNIDLVKSRQNSFRCKRSLVESSPK